MRLDKFISASGVAGRKDCARAARAGLILLNGRPARDPSVHIDEEHDEIIYCGEHIIWRRFVYIMLNKPAGAVSTTDGDVRSVINLLPDKYSRLGLFPCGRLDADTVGLLLLTNDGALAHSMLSPRRHVAKTYFFRCNPPITEDAAEQLRRGIDIGDCVTLPAGLTHSGSEGEITLVEGKYHQIKRMLCAVGSNVTYLRRITFGALSLDETLAEGQFRELTDAEISLLYNTQNNK